jgi:hypothetical protein
LRLNKAGADDDEESDDAGDNYAVEEKHFL